MLIMIILIIPSSDHNIKKLPLMAYDRRRELVEFLPDS